MVQKPTVRNEHIAAYRAGELELIPENILAQVKERVEAMDALGKPVAVEPAPVLRPWATTEKDEDVDGNK